MVVRYVILNHPMALQEKIKNEKYTHAEIRKELEKQHSILFKALKGGGHT